MHLGLKRNFQVMPGAQWLELLCKHIPDRYEQLVRYVGWYSSRSRAARKAKGATAVATTASGVTEALSEHASRAKAAWARIVAGFFAIICLGVGVLGVWGVLRDLLRRS